MGAADHWSPNIGNNDRFSGRPAEHLLGLKVTQNMLPMLVVKPMLGRLFTKGEDRQGANQEVILSYSPVGEALPWRSQRNWNGRQT